MGKDRMGRRPRRRCRLTQAALGRWLEHLWAAWVPVSAYVGSSKILKDLKELGGQGPNGSSPQTEVSPDPSCPLLLQE